MTHIQNVKTYIRKIPIFFPTDKEQNFGPSKLNKHNNNYCIYVYIA